MSKIKELIQNILSVKNEDVRKVFTICGIRFKFKSQKLLQRKQFKVLEQILNLSLQNISELNNKQNNLLHQNQNLAVLCNGLKSQFDNCCLDLKNNYDQKLNLIVTDLKTDSNQKHEELICAEVFNNLIRCSDWVKHQDFIPVRGAATYSFLFILYVILNNIQPKNILEFGMGQTSKLTTDYVEYKNNSAKLHIVDHDQNWIDYFSGQLAFNENISFHQKDLINFDLNGVQSDKYSDLSDITTNQKFDLILIDGPFGYSRKYPRTNILDLIPQCLDDEFIIILDDAERQGEKNTAELIFKKLDECGIKYSKYYKIATKTQLIITSPKYSFIKFY